MTAVVVAAVVMVGQPSFASGAGAELTEPLGAEANGAEAYVGVSDVAPFSTSGGEAVLEPGSPYEEAFSYSGVDADAGRLVGLDRAAPVAHAAGAYVAAQNVDPATPTPAPTPAAEPSPEGTEAEPEEAEPAEPGDAGGAPAGDAGTDTPSESSAVLDPCEMVFDRTCLEVVTDTVGENPCDIGSGTGRTCDELVDEVVGDPCGTLLDNTCLGWVLDVVGENPCDIGSGTGRTCDELINDLANDPCGTLFDNTCLGWILDIVGENPCDIGSGTGRTCDELINQLANDPCGTVVGDACVNWVTAVAQAVQQAACGDMNLDECTDEGVMPVPDVWDVVDPVIDGALADDCDLSIRGPWRDDEGPTAGVVVRGFGKYHCATHEHPSMSIKVCLDKKIAGAWQKIECHANGSDLLGDPHQAEARVAQGCMKSGKFRVRARGQATDGNKVLESDSDKSIAWINCKNVLE